MLWQNHRDMARVQMPAKIFPHLKVKCYKILTILFILIMRKSHFSDEFLVLLGPIISKFLHDQMQKKIKIKKVLALLLSVWAKHVIMRMNVEAPVNAEFEIQPI